MTSNDPHVTNINNNYQHQQQQSHQPFDQTFLEQTSQLLVQSQSSDGLVQRDVQQKLSEWNQLPQFNYALVCVFANKDADHENTRSLSGLILKNNVRLHYSNFTQELKEFVKKTSLELLNDPSPLVRSTATSLISTIAASGEIITWSELLPSLTQLIVSPNELVAVSAFEAMEKICEDMSEVLCNAEMSTTLDAMISGFIELFHHPNPKIRTHALTCVHHFIPLEVNGIIANMDKYVKALFHLANDTDKEVKKNVCRSLNAIFEVNPEALAPYLDDIIHFMRLSSNDEDQAVALEACEFWLAVSDNPHGREVLAKHLHDLIPFLVEKMRYSEEEIMNLFLEIGDDFRVPDKDDDIKPMFARHKNTLTNAGDSEAQPSNGEDGDDDDDDDDFMDDDSNNVWNIRRCAAASLDYMAHSYGEDILPILYPILQGTIAHSDWIIKEAAILTLGAIADGCKVAMAPNLPVLIPYLIEGLKDNHALVRSITCWTLSRYTSWICEHPKERHFDTALQGLLYCILDNNKRVQEAACSAFATLCEGANVELALYLDSILDVLIQAFEKYQHKNLLSLYDAIGTLATAVKHHLNQPKYINKLMPPIINKWNQLLDDDQDLFPLLECLSCIAVAMGEGFMPYSEGVFKRCLSLVDSSLQQEIKFGLDPANQEMPNKDFTIAALDLISGLAEGLKHNITNLVVASNVLELCIKCMQDSSAEVRQSSFALLGDLTKACFHLVRPHLDDVMRCLSQNLLYENVSVCNNATWTIGEIAMKMGPDMRTYVNLFIRDIINNINEPNVPRTLLDNTAISLGRLSLVCSDDLAPHLKTFIKPWCLSVRSIRDNEAKDSAFRGICQLISKNPTGIVEDFFHICDAIACWDEPQADLKQVLHELLHSFKNHIGDQTWQQYREQFAPDIKEKLLKHYGL